MRGRRLWSDVALVLVLIVPSLLEVDAGMYAGAPPYRSFGWLTALYAITAVTPLLARRRWPSIVLAAVTLTVVAAKLGSLPAMPADLALLVALWAAGAHGWARAPARMIVGVSAAIITVVVAWSTVEPAASMAAMAWGFLLSALGLAALPAMGALYAKHRQLADVLAQRAEELERTQDALAQSAVAQERLRLAREVHDIVAHALGGAVLTADAVALTVAEQPEHAAAVLEQLAAEGRRALVETQRLLSPITTDDEGLVGIDALVATARLNGLRVHVETRGAIDRVPIDLAAEAYRVVREALTNARRHASADTVHIRLDARSDGVSVVVADDGTGGNGQPGKGRGLAGLRDRVARRGGTLTIGPVRTGGWTVEAWLPAAGADDRKDATVSRALQ